ncbi:MAG: DUF4249 domain-containing protein [Limnohabitans sp.]|nr:DUF4249 domain-containing protein [Limnohabitans sp.]
MRKLLYKSFLLIAICFIYSCTEPYALQSDTFENVLVVEATITNELKKQEIKLSRTYPLEESGSKIEKGATVYIVDNNGNRYDFQENNDSYISNTIFQAQPNKTYELHIQTSDGKTYVSNREKLTSVSPITEISKEIIIKDNTKGVQLGVKSFDPTNSSKYYRFEYEETYKIIAPKWVPIKAFRTSLTTYELSPRISEAKVCYGFKKSNSIIQLATNTLLEDRVNLPIRFIDSKDYIIGNRYSILIKQYVQNLEAYTYYRTLSQLSQNQNILSQNQPGFLSGNIRCENNTKEKVAGFFEIASVSEKRIFFNFSDLFPNDEPKYIVNCSDDAPNIKYQFCFEPPRVNPHCKGREFLAGLEDKKIAYHSETTLDPVTDLKLITAYDIKCGDCSSFASNIKPAFWID